MVEREVRNPTWRSRDLGASCLGLKPDVPGGTIYHYSRLQNASARKRRDPRSKIRARPRRESIGCSRPPPPPSTCSRNPLRKNCTGLALGIVEIGLNVPSTTHVPEILHGKTAQFMFTVDNVVIRRCVGCYRVFTCDKDIKKKKNMTNYMNRSVWCKGSHFAAQDTDCDDEVSGNWEELRISEVFSLNIAIGRGIHHPRNMDLQNSHMDWEYLDGETLNLQLMHGVGRIVVDSDQECKNTVHDFEAKWNFPHCLGAMDGRHITIVAPNGSGSAFYNYKGRHGMVLLAIVDASYQFVMCDFGRISDGGVLKNTRFIERLKNHQLNTPREDTMGNCSTAMPYVFVVDDVSPLRVDVMKPFRQTELMSLERRIYNYRVSRARRIVENVFGILASRFRIFHTAINLHPKNIEPIVLTTCLLHDVLVKSVQNGGITNLGYDTNNTRMLGLSNTSRTAEKVRDDFMNYFVNEGQVSWQLNFI
ncbi:hypothetical protein PR048_004357 [Dryococelus australis]|uniref:DDE Tnp4 domain-containing protein n=1 Tax=Dryococelus australis TaxID=614101 RepID=A0ABQ9I754_9NEOP|nr:hypothetical protein PR048_004357 [Dryococelus australis]